MLAAPISAVLQAGVAIPPVVLYKLQRQCSPYLPFSLAVHKLQCHLPFNCKPCATSSCTTALSVVPLLRTAINLPPGLLFSLSLSSSSNISYKLLFRYLDLISSPSIAMDVNICLLVWHNHGVQESLRSQRHN